MNAMTNSIEAQSRQLTISAEGHVWTSEFNNCDELIPSLKQITRGWKAETLPDVTDQPDFRVTYDGSKYHSEFYEASKLQRGEFISSTAVVWEMHYALIESLPSQRPEHLVLHCAAVKMGDGIVLFPSVGRAGKSTLVTALAARGYRLYGDDVIAISHENSKVSSLGFLPRIRLPLPIQAVDQGFLDFVERHKCLTSQVAQYLDLDDSLLASFGESLPVKAIVHLKRINKVGPVELQSTDTASGLKSIIYQSLASDIKASQKFETLYQTAINADCYDLKYSKLDDAIAALTNEFGN